MRLVACCLLSLFGVRGADSAPQRPPVDYLQACWRQQGQPLQGRCLQLRYQETVNELEHNAVPWQTAAYTGRGTVWLTADAFVKQDTLTAVATARSVSSTTQRSATSLLYRDYGATDLSAVTQAQQQAYVYRAARYCPLSLLAYFQQHPVAPDAPAPAGLVSYQATLRPGCSSSFEREMCSSSR